MFEALAFVVFCDWLESVDDGQVKVASGDDQRADLDITLPGSSYDATVDIVIIPRFDYKIESSYRICLRISLRS